MLKRLIAVAVVAALPVVAVPASAAPAATTRQTRVISDCQHPHYEPKRIILTCGDANMLLTHLSYVKWRAKRVEGAGRFVYNDCEPNCAAGHFHHFHVTVTLSRVRVRHHHRLFTRLVTTNYRGAQQTYALPTKGV